MSLGGFLEHAALPWMGIFAVAMSLAKAVATDWVVCGMRFVRGLDVLYLLRHRLLSTAWKSLNIYSGRLRR